MTVSAPGFTGFHPDAIAFLADLAENNERAWFQPRKAEYERLLKAPMEALVAALAERFEARGIPLLADPKHSIFRIYRDTRFSKDKSPYKTHLGASFPWVGRVGGPVDGAETEVAHANGGYFNFGPGDIYVGGGMWLPERPRMEAFRRAIVDHPDQVRAALEDPGVLATFGQIHPHGEYKRVPPGWPADHPLADWLRFKDVVFGRHLSDDEATSADLPDILATDYETALPIFRFLATLDE
jgi:uncharacterized protein (TIGR02453 family)